MPTEVPSAPPGRPPGTLPGARRARHQRWTRIAAAVTVVSLLAFVAFVGMSVLGGEGEGDRVVGCRQYLADLAAEVSKFAARTGRMPAELGELAGVEGESPFDAEPWDCWHHPFEYRVVDEGRREFRLRSYGGDGKPDTPDDLVWPPGAAWR